MKVTIPFSVSFSPFQPKAFGQALLSDVFLRGNLIESDYFGLEYQNMQMNWVRTRETVSFVFCLKRGHAGLSRNRHANGSDTSAKRFKVSKVTAWWQHAASEATRWTRVSHFSGNQSLIFSSLQLRAQWCSIVFTGLEQCIIQEYF